MLNRFPEEKQLDLKDCGPASLRIIAKHYKVFHSLQYLRELCGANKRGVSLLDISNAAEEIGLRSYGANISFEELVDYAPLPCIVHWKRSHFIVVYRITAQKVFVSDPAKGLLSYTIDEFKRGWLGNSMKWSILILEPMIGFRTKVERKKLDKRRTLKSILEYFYPYKRAFYNLFVVMLVATILQGLLPFISKAVIDVGIQTNDLDFINIVLLVAGNLRC